MAAVLRNPKDSMKSTWYDDKSNWSFSHWFLHVLDTYPTIKGKEIPVFPKTAKVPYLSEWSIHQFVIISVAWPMALQRLYIYLTGQNIPAIAAFFLYTIAYQLNGVREAHRLRDFGHRLGFLDGDKHARDEIPDVGVGKVVLSVQLTTIIRPLFTIFLAYRASEGPSVSWWLPVELALYSVVLDFWFYCYHRACHEVDWLWRYHRTHHLTKHPNVMMSSYADSEQEFIEIMLVPLLTYGSLKLMGMPMGFYDWWICQSYIFFAEIMGHSGVRLYACTPGIHGLLLKYFNCDLAVEDHDLHHRHGWKKAANYGKQTRVWDRLFGTCTDRIECAADNVDWENPVCFPIF